MLQEVRTEFLKLFSSSPRLFCSPGRINIIGEHTDYNEGFVLPAAIEKNIYFAIAPNTCGKFRFYAYNLQEFKEFDSIKHQKKQLWENYLLGVVSQMQKTGKMIPSVDVVFGGTIPWGSGLSSSAALECGFAYALNEIFSLGFSKLELVKLSQLVEHESIGVNCGIMDQFAVMFGKKNHVIQLDCKSLEYNLFPWNVEGYTLLLCNSGVKHSLASSEYNVRRRECEDGVTIVSRHAESIHSLRDISSEQLERYASEMQGKTYQRCRYILDENERVQQMGKALLNGDAKQVGTLLFAAHTGMSCEYEASCVEIDEMVNIARSCGGVVGSRITGGGFGGCTITLVERDAVDSFTKQMTSQYYVKHNISPSFMEVVIGDGTREL